MRISKEGDVRKQEFLDTALELFYEKGYEKTSINDIIDQIGVTKGAFYYYFKSKEEVLQTLAREYAENKLAVIQMTADNEQLNALEKINKIIIESQEYRTKNKGYRLKIHKVFKSEENQKLLRKIYENTLKLIYPVMKSMIEQGVKEGIFNTSDPGELAELYLYIGIIMRKSISELVYEKDEQQGSIELLERRLRFYQETFERILGVEAGAIELVKPLLANISHFKTYKLDVCAYFKADRD